MVPNDLLNQYDLIVKRSQYSRSNFLLDTNKGKYILRKVNIQTEQILFMYDAINHLRKNGFMEVEVIYLTKKNLPYATSKGQIYIMQSYTTSNDVEFKDTTDIKGIIRLLANFHTCGLNFDATERSEKIIHIKDVYVYFQKRIRDTNTLKKKVLPLSKKTEFEHLFLKDYTTYLTLQHLALECIDKESIDNLIKYAQTNKSLAHNDYNYHSVTKIGDNIYLSNLEKCSYNMQILDLCSILMKVMQKNNWDTDLLVTLIKEYEDIRTLSPEEKSILKAMMIFPEKFASICNKYLQCKRRNNYSMFLVKWNNMIVYKEEQVLAAHFIKDNL